MQNDSVLGFFFCQLKCSGPLVNVSTPTFGLLVRLNTVCGSFEKVHTGELLGFFKVFVVYFTRWNVIQWVFVAIID